MSEADSPDTSDRAALERLVGASVDDLALYVQALTHRSVRREEGGSPLHANERLEFLGDAVLGTVIAEALYERFPEKSEGYLTRLRAKLVSGKALAQAARRLEVGPYLKMSANMVAADGRSNPAILADAYEALLGAVYLDRGLSAARAFVRRTLLDPVSLTELAGRSENYKSLLLEYRQARGCSQPAYRIARAEGPSHDRTFTAEVLLDGEPYGRGVASSKKKAEQQAAHEALRRLCA